MKKEKVFIGVLLAAYAILIAVVSIDLYLSAAENGLGQEYMGDLYPRLTGSLAAYLIVRLVFWWTTRRTSVALADVVYIAHDAVITMMLTLLTGDSPRFDISEYRWLVSAVRTTMFYSVWLSIIVTSLMIFQQGTKKD